MEHVKTNIMARDVHSPWFRRQMQFCHPTAKVHITSRNSMDDVHLHYTLERLSKTSSGASLCRHALQKYIVLSMSWLT